MACTEARWPFRLPHNVTCETNKDREVARVLGIDTFSHFRSAHKLVSHFDGGDSFDLTQGGAPQGGGGIFNPAMMGNIAMGMAMGGAMPMGGAMMGGYGGPNMNAGPGGDDGKMAEQFQGLGLGDGKGDRRLGNGSDGGSGTRARSQGLSGPSGQGGPRPSRGRGGYSGSAGIQEGGIGSGNFMDGVPAKGIECSYP